MSLYTCAREGGLCPFYRYRSDDLNLLKETLEEGKRADEKLTELSETVNQQAADESQEEEMPASKTSNRVRRTKSAA